MLKIERIKIKNVNFDLKNALLHEKYIFGKNNKNMRNDAKCRI